MTKNIEKPNIVFILMDDLGWRDLSCYGSNFYETPNIDQLASESMLFTNAYASAPVCSPTRASIITGKYPARLGLTNYISARQPGHRDLGYLIDAPYVPHLPSGQKSLAAKLKEDGYTTWHIGKWHLGGGPYSPENNGFDVNIGGTHLGAPPTGYFSPWNIPSLLDRLEGEYLTDRLTEEAIKLIANNTERPFFLNLWHYAVHTPIEAKQVLIDKYETKARVMGLEKAKTFQECEVHPKSITLENRIRRRLVQSDPVYAAMIESVDESIGKLIDILKKTDQMDQTIIIFTSDNGGLATSEGSPTCNEPLSEGKGWVYEGGTREPLFIHWPGVTQPNSSCDIPVISTDFYPTILEMIGVDLIPNQHQDGVSLVPLLEGAEKIDREAIYWHYPHYGNQGGTPASAVRSGDWKLIEFFEDDRLELYNLHEDISESVNLSLVELETKERLHTLLKAWRQSHSVLIPQTNAEWPWK